MKGNSRTTEAMLRPLSKQILILFCFFMSMYVSLTSSKAMVSLELIRYTNPTHQDLNGDCCEWVCWNLLGLAVCDNYISLCVDDIESASDSMHKCLYYKMDKLHEGDDEFCFPSTLGSYHHNPILFEVDNYTGGFRLKLDVWDEDFSLFGLNSDDHIDFYNEKIFLTPSPSVHSASTHLQTLHGYGSSRIPIEVKAYCADDYYGINCSVYCLACDNDVDGHYTCDPSTGDKICIPGYEGTLCKIDINECESSPCQNGGTCRNYLNYFMCECEEGKPGNLCEKEVNECESRPCQNSGTCLDMVNGFQCNCTSGYYGLLCETDHDDCASNPCSNGATCTNVLNGYVCNCAAGFIGIHCKGSYSTILFISLSIAAVILIVVALTFVRRRRHYVKSYNLKSNIEHKPLLISSSVNEESLDCARSADMSSILNFNLQESPLEEMSISQFLGDF